MKQINISVSFDDEKLRALNKYLKKKELTAEDELAAALEDYLNVYANYIVSARQVDDTLDIMICRSVGSNEAAVYKLSETEKEIVLEKMDEYCQEREGMTLDEYCESVQTECLTPEL